MSPVNEKWSPENGAKLERLRKKDIMMGDMAVRPLETRKKKELTAVLGKSNMAERDGWKARLI